MRPSVSYGYTLVLKNITIRTLLMQLEPWSKYSRFENGIYGAPGLSNANTLGFDLSNTFEAKVTDKDSKGWA
jgi:uncharacterized membrane protein